MKAIFSNDRFGFITNKLLIPWQMSKKDTTEV